MKTLLAIDTASGSTGAAVMVDGEVLGAGQVVRVYRHSESIIALIDKVLDEAGVKKNALTGVVVTHGPGAFTGLRVGIATAKGIATGLGVQVAGVSSLRALSLNATTTDTIVVPLFDARKGQVYGAAYDGATGAEIIPEGAWEPAELASRVGEWARQSGKKACFLGSGVAPYEAVLREGVGDNFQPMPEEKGFIDPACVAKLGAEQFDLGRALDPAFLAPVYHRLSEAEEKKNKDRLAKTIPL